MNRKKLRATMTMVLFILTLIGTMGLYYVMLYWDTFDNPNNKTVDNIYEIIDIENYMEHNYDYDYQKTSFIKILSVLEQFREGYKANPNLELQYISYNDYNAYVSGDTTEYKLKEADSESWANLLTYEIREQVSGYNDDSIEYNLNQIDIEENGGIEKLKKMYPKIDNTCFVRINIDELVKILAEGGCKQKNTNDSNICSYEFEGKNGKEIVYYDSDEGHIYTKGEGTIITNYAYIPVDMNADKKVGVELLTNGIYSLEKVMCGINIDYVVYKTQESRLHNHIFQFKVIIDDNEIYSNVKKIESDDSTVVYKYNIISDDKSYVDIFYDGTKLYTKYEDEYTTLAKERGLDNITIIFGMDALDDIQGRMQLLENIYSTKDYIDSIMYVSIALLIISLIVVISLMLISAKTKEELTILERFVDNIWLEILFLVYIWLVFFVLVVNDNIAHSLINECGISMLVVLYIVNYMVIFTIIYSSIFTVIRRIKTKELFKKLLAWRLLNFLYKVYKNSFKGILRIYLKKEKLDNCKEVGNFLAICFVIIDIVLLFGIIVAYNVYFIFKSSFLMMLALAVILMIKISVYAVYWIYVNKRLKALQKLYDGTKTIYEGELEYKIDNAMMNDFEKDMVDFINNIGEGFSKAANENLKAIEKSIKDERLKAELITNVSHDIKTPLTSIINYVDLLKSENVEGENANKYIDVIDKKSQRLKMLAEDLVEASRITSGNIELYKEKLDFKELINQALAEFEEKYSEKNLLVDVKFTEEDIEIFADGRRTFRIIDNLLQNVYKYSMRGTRVYIELCSKDDMAVFGMKNISEKALNIDPKELVERFKRGDESRTTEGSGLGLSIADSLVKLHGGEMIITIDGDLFKVNIKMPKYCDGDEQQ